MPSHAIIEWPIGDSLLHVLLPQAFNVVFVQWNIMAVEYGLWGNILQRAV